MHRVTTHSGYETTIVAALKGTFIITSVATPTTLGVELGRTQELFKQSSDRRTVASGNLSFCTDNLKNKSIIVKLYKSINKQVISSIDKLS